MRRRRLGSSGAEISLRGLAGSMATCARNEKWKGKPYKTPKEHLTRVRRARRKGDGAREKALPASFLPSFLPSRCNCPYLSPAHNHVRRPFVRFGAAFALRFIFGVAVAVQSRDWRGERRERETGPDERTFSKLSTAIARSLARSLSPSFPSPCGRPLPPLPPLTTANDRRLQSELSVRSFS